MYSFCYIMLSCLLNICTFGEICILTDFRAFMEYFCQYLGSMLNLEDYLLKKKKKKSLRNHPLLACLIEFKCEKG